jgi:phosphohistidine swiveling domain-containing protein
LQVKETTMHILWLDDPGCHDPQLVGGKAAQLARLAAGFDVPYGFCVPAPMLAHLDADDSFPVSLQAAITTAYQALASYAGVADPSVAVRSSAIDEDSAELSFAGLHETLLNVVGAPALIAAVERCARSAYTARATAYREHHTRDASSGVAVLVQLFVDADASAVAFSADPVSGDRSQISIEASVGLGESLVGGEVTPDRYILRKRDLQIISRQVADKLHMSVPTEGGVARVAVPQERRSAPALGDGQIAAIARLARELEQRLGHAVDMECAVAGERLVLLQCRPITTIGGGTQEAPAVTWDVPSDANLTWRWGRQAFPGPVTPLVQSYLPFHTQGWLRDSRANGTAGEIRIRIEQGYYYTIWQPTGLTTWEEVDRRAREAECAAPERWEREFLPRLRADHERIQSLDRAALTNGELALALQQSLTAQVEHFTIHAHMASFPYGAVDRLLNWYAERFPGEPETDAYRLLLGLDNTSVANAHALWELSQHCDDAVADALQAREWDRLPESFAARWEAYLSVFGHRTRALADPASPTWREEPAPVAQLILSYARATMADPAGEHARLAVERVAFVEQVQARLHPDERDGFADLLATAQANYPLTEDHNFWIDQQSPADLRLLCAELGRRMSECGALTSTDDIAYLTLSELVLWGFGLTDPLRARVAERKTEHERQRRLTPPDYLGAPPEPQTWIDRFGGPAVPLSSAPGTVQGIGASSGRAVGRVRVAQTFDDAQRLQVGEVLVCPATDPSWAPVFAVAAALVTDTGGSLCHGAVLAREYRLPAVVGTHVGTTRLRTGQFVEVDGLVGSIRLLEA